jgi:WD40 repeat protein
MSVAFSPDGRRIVSGSLDGTARIWDADTSEVVGILEDQSGPVMSVAVSLDGRQIVSGGVDGIRIWDARTRQVNATIKEGEGVLSVAFSPDSRKIVSTSLGPGPTVDLWDSSTGKLLRSLDPQASSRIALPSFSMGAAFSPDGRYLAAAWDLMAPSPPMRPPAPSTLAAPGRESSTGGGRGAAGDAGLARTALLSVKHVPPMPARN